MQLRCWLQQQKSQRINIYQCLEFVHCDWRHIFCFLFFLIWKVLLSIFLKITLNLKKIYVIVIFNPMDNISCKLLLEIIFTREKKKLPCFLGRQRYKWDYIFFMLFYHSRESLFCRLISGNDRTRYILCVLCTGKIIQFWYIIRFLDPNTITTGNHSSM